MNQPPRLILALFRWFCTPEFREDIEGDLLERFQHQSTEFGYSRAKWLFMKEVLQLFRPDLIRGLRNSNYDQTSGMNKSKWIKLVLANLLLIFAILSPFLPGPPNQVVIGVSAFAQGLGFVGLLLVPIGIAWTILEIRKRNSQRKTYPNKPIFSLAVAATAVLTLFYALFNLPVYMTSGTFMGILVSLTGMLLLTLAIKSLVKMKNSETQKFNATPIYLVVVPITSLIMLFYIMKPLVNYSRNRTIQKSQEVIAMIEEFKNKNGKYPASLEDLEQSAKMKIPKPDVMGVLNFRYNNIDGQYSLSFSQWLEVGSLEELVLYDKDNLRDNLKGEYAKYDYGFDLCRTKGAFANYGTKFNNWKYFHLD